MKKEKLNEIENDRIKSKSKIKNKKKKKKHPILKRVLIVILIVILVVVGVFIYKVQKNGGGLKGLITTVVGSDIDKVNNLDDLYLLCIGKSQNMTDTLMVVKYSPKTQSAVALSVPRDSYVGTNKATASAWDKINAKYQINPQATVDAVNKLTGLNLKYYLTVDTQALRRLVDTVGGVYFDVPIDMDYDDCTQDLAIHLKAGYQLLDGVQAEGVVRFRHNNNGTSYSTEYGDNDLGRMRTQREFIKEVFKQVMKAENITKINKLFEIAQQEVATNIPWDVLKDYIPAFVDFNAENLKTDALPGTPRYINNFSFFLVDEAATAQKVNELFFAYEDNTTKKDDENGDADGNSVSENTVNEQSNVVAPSKKNSEITIELYNGVGSTTRFNQAVTQLKNKGYNIVRKGTTNITQKTTIIDRANNSVADEEKIMSLLCAGSVIDGESTDVDFTIVIGADY